MSHNKLNIILSSAYVPTTRLAAVSTTRLTDKGALGLGGDPEIELGVD